jgi:hypothetical protein
VLGEIGRLLDWIGRHNGLDCGFGLEKSLSEIVEGAQRTSGGTVTFDYFFDDFVVGDRDVAHRRCRLLSRRGDLVLTSMPIVLGGLPACCVEHLRCFSVGILLCDASYVDL